MKSGQAHLYSRVAGGSLDCISDEVTAVDSLAEREREVLALLECDMTSSDVGVGLGTSKRGVHCHGSNIR